MLKYQIARLKQSVTTQNEILNLLNPNIPMKHAQIKYMNIIMCPKQISIYFKFAYIFWDRKRISLVEENDNIIILHDKQTSLSKQISTKKS